MCVAPRLDGGPRTRAMRRKKQDSLDTPGAGWAQKKYLTTAKRLPDGYDLVPFVESGYRVGYGSCACVASVFQLHNQTLNVWTHLVGFIYFAYLLVDAGRPRDADALVVFALRVSAALMTGASSAYHTFSALPPKACAAWLCVDKVGIASMIGGSFVPGVWFAFRCLPAARTCYLGAAFLVWILGVALAANVVPERHHARGFAALVIFGLLPTCHFAATASRVVIALFLPRLLIMFALYGLGFFFYASHWPESRWPGRVDLVGASHQLWHVCVLGAALAWDDAAALRCPA